MPVTLDVSRSTLPHVLYSFIRNLTRNFFRSLGSAEELETSHKRHRKAMYPSPKMRGVFPTLPRDYIRRRRAVRKITNVLLVVLLSAAVAYAIVHATGPAPFSPPHS